MAALFCNSRRMELSAALTNVGELKGVIADMLKKDGFTDVVNTRSEVAGNRSGLRLSVLHLHISDRSFWQLVMAGGDTGNVTKSAVDEVMAKIKKLKFL
jgi:hypothetical protein